MGRIRKTRSNWLGEASDTLMSLTTTKQRTQVFADLLIAQTTSGDRECEKEWKVEMDESIRKLQMAHEGRNPTQPTRHAKEMVK